VLATLCGAICRWAAAVFGSWPNATQGVIGALMSVAVAFVVVWMTRGIERRAAAEAQARGAVAAFVELAGDVTDESWGESYRGPSPAQHLHRPPGQRDDALPLGSRLGGRQPQQAVTLPSHKTPPDVDRAGVEVDLGPSDGEALADAAAVANISLVMSGGSHACA
jgi:hypothetical protein